MTKHKLQARLGATAIAAALALSSTPLLAQQAAPDATQSAPSTAPAPDSAPATDSAPTVAVPDITTATPDTSTSTSTATAPAEHATVRHTTAAAKPAATTSVHTASRTVTSQHVAPVAAAPVATPVAAPPVAATAPASAASPPPLAQVVGPPPAAANSNQQTQSNSTAEILGAAIFALIVLGAIAYALARRRRRETVYEEQAYEPETAYVEPEPLHTRAPIAVEQPAIVAPETSAFAWGNRPQAGKLETSTAARAEADEPMTLPNGFDLSRFGPHVRAAYRGPTPDNPSLSLRNRLRRAAAMDQKERAMGAGAGDGPINGEAVTEHRELADA